MATSSFDRDFVITDKKSAKQLARAFLHPQKVNIIQRDYEADSKKGIELLSRLINKPK